MIAEQESAMTVLERVEMLKRFGVPERLHDSCWSMLFKPEVPFFEATGEMDSELGLPKWAFTYDRGHCNLTELEE